ncbi:hypothetical protein SteCoe_5635 [Stentor coeruleus]|uniref:PARP catalytic domain-containing protein n=1 Tax=Stentor coeruleus TaxID=5963 RepID=A0A1R2CRV3_9CILI|nr:hypothetical protein SteCoe_5635 [Stentor coeruleus]
MNPPRTSCAQCRRNIPLNASGSSFTCGCSTVLCTSCGFPIHPGYTCYYNLATTSYQVIDLSQPTSIPNLQPLLTQENNKVINHFNSTRGNLNFIKAHLIINKPLEERYLAKKNLMASQCGGANRVNEILVWHGSSEANYASIMRDGLKVGGVDGISAVHGTSYGYGVYSGKSFSTAVGYVNGSKKVILFNGLLGNNSGSAINSNSVQALNNGSTHSYTSGDISVFFTKEQVIPRFLVEYS